MFRRSISWVVIITFAFFLIGPYKPAEASGTVLGLPAPGVMINLSPAYEPVMIKGLKVHSDNPFALDFIVDTGNSGLTARDRQLKIESQRLIKYFFAALTLPEKEVWVNLSPYEKNRIIPRATGQTALGRDMLAQDYILKQMTASLIYPEKRLGKDFWDRIYKEAYERFGTNNIPVNTFNKVWIVADKAGVYESKDTVLVVESHLKVMLEEDYLSLQKHSAALPYKGPSNRRGHIDTSSIGANIVREIILPALEKEVNEGRNFATLRQIFHSIILAKWYKESLKNAVLNQVYSNQHKIAGVDLADKNIKEKIYQQYLKAYKKGVFNYIKEDNIPCSFDCNASGQKTIPRKYFSGGVLGYVKIKHYAAMHWLTGLAVGTLVFVNALAQVDFASMADSNEDQSPAFERGASITREGLWYFINLLRNGEDLISAKGDEEGKTFLLEMATKLKLKVESVPVFDLWRNIVGSRSKIEHALLEENKRKILAYLIRKVVWVNFMTVGKNDKGVPLVRDFELTIEGVPFLVKITNKTWEMAQSEGPKILEYSFILKADARLSAESTGTVFLFHNRYGDKAKATSFKVVTEDLDKRPFAVKHAQDPLHPKNDESDVMISSLEVPSERTRLAVEIWFSSIDDWTPQGIKPNYQGEARTVHLPSVASQNTPRLRLVDDAPSAPIEIVYVNPVRGVSVNRSDIANPEHQLGKHLNDSITFSNLKLSYWRITAERAAALEGPGVVTRFTLMIDNVIKGDVEIKGVMPEKINSQYIERILTAMKVEVTDAGMGAAKIEDPGGIDLNTSGMQWKVSKDGRGIEMIIDPAFIARIRREGINRLSPFIIKITSIASVWSLVGLKDPKGFAL